MSDTNDVANTLKQDPFKYNGQYANSSEIPTIKIGDQEISRADFRKGIIDKAIAELPAVPEGKQPVYVATGGGYGSFDKLIEFERGKGTVGPETEIKSLKGALFRNLPEFEAEKKDVRAQIQGYLTSKGVEPTTEAVEQVLSAFYSDEVNTKIAKEVVKASFEAKKSAIYESASIYPDTIERAEAAKKQGIKTALIAGDKDFRKAIEDLKERIEPGNTAISYQKFSARFEKELVPLFDEIRLYNTDQEPPKLIAEKKGSDQKLEILDQALFARFLANGVIDPEQYKSKAADANVINVEHKERDAKAKEAGKDVAPQVPPPAPKKESPGTGR